MKNALKYKYEKVNLMRIPFDKTFTLSGCHLSNGSDSSKKSSHLQISMARQWILNSQDGFETSLEYQDNVTVPSAKSLGPTDVLVRMYAASLNYRELVIAGPIVCVPSFARSV